MTDAAIIEWLQGKCVPGEGGCLIWTGAVGHKGVPAVRNPFTNKTGSARRLLMQAMGHRIQGKVCTTKCCDPRCMAKDHVVAWSRQELQKRSSQKFRYDVVRSAKLAEAARAKSSLSMQLVRAMRASGMRAKEASEHFGVPFQTACRIISGRNWKDYDNPFAGLGARAANDSQRRAA
ncbi:hypothetical protein [Ramlibacter sp.]|uniref:hypothetical protein n=1 Tax=Ramlibacter sp. TaxID=1917967 RepID=UPI002D34D472|nr:hypothetical protein [Ramlibacter sp.]HYD75755.1 hypothetical protein [Ramlibacter sp.]